MKTIKKFVEILNTHSKSQSLSNFQDSMLILTFLNEMGLDSSSAGDQGQFMNISRHVQRQQIATKRDSLVFDLQSKKDRTAPVAEIEVTNLSD